MTRQTLVFAVAALLLAALGAGGGYWFALRRMHATPAAQTPAQAPMPDDKSAAASGRRVLYWHDPMVPGQKFDKPGKSPFMNMELVPVYADEVSDEGKVTINARTLQNLGIRLAEVKQSPLDMRFAATGAVSVDDRTLSAVQVRVNGYIEKLHVRAQYDSVANGQPLADIYSPEWLAAQEEYLVLLRATQPDTQALASAARARLALLGIPQAQIARIEQSGRPEPRITVHAPEAALVWEIGAREGMAVNPGLTLFRLANLNTVWVNAEVPESQAALVRPGAPVSARVTAFPDAEYRGHVATLLPDVNASTRTIKARIVLANPGARLKPGMFATLEFGASTLTALTVPSEALIYTGRRTVVIVAQEGGKFSPVEVETGREAADRVEIRKGLSLGQNVVASGQFLIDSEASLKTTLSRLQSAPEPAASAAKPAQHTGSGKVNRVDTADGTLEITHGPMPSLKWPAMTMMFRADKSLLANAKAGDEIEFDVLEKPDKDGDYIVTRITRRSPTGHAGATK